jgi:hypothetical protein
MENDASTRPPRGTETDRGEGTRGGKNNEKKSNDSQNDAKGSK